MKENFKIIKKAWWKMLQRFLIASVLVLIGITKGSQYIVYPEFTWIDGIMQVFALLIYCNGIYIFFWGIGQKDRNSVNYERMKEDKFRSLKLGLLTASPYFIWCGIMVLFKLIQMIFPFGQENAMWDILGIHRLLNYHIYWLNSWIIGGADATIFNVSIWRVLLTGLLPFIIPVFAVFGYHFGYKQTALFEKILYTSNKNKK